MDYFAVKLYTNKSKMISRYLNDFYKNVSCKTNACVKYWFFPKNGISGYFKILEF